MDFPGWRLMVVLNFFLFYRFGCFVFQFLLVYLEWFGLGQNQDENFSITSMGCCYLTHLRNDGVPINKDEPFFKRIFAKTGKFINKPFKVRYDLGKLWQDAASHNGLDPLEYSGVWFYGFCECVGFVCGVAKSARRSYDWVFDKLKKNCVVGSMENEVCFLVFYILCRFFEGWKKLNGNKKMWKCSEWSFHNKQCTRM